MLAQIDVFGLSVVEVAALLAAFVYGIREIADVTGRSRSSKTLRVENMDLVRRNAELEPLLDKVQRLQAEVDALTIQVTDLQKRDQGAVLEALALHERNAGMRNEATLGKLGEIRDALNR